MRGEIEGFLDVIIDDKPMICYDDSDDEDRVCFGRKKIFGDTMSVIASGQSGTPSGRTLQCMVKSTYTMIRMV